VGKSTSILNLAGILAEATTKTGKSRVLLIDLDPQQSANRCLSGKINVQSNNLPEALVASPVGAKPLINRIKPSNWERVWYIPSDLQGMIDASSQMVQIGRHVSPMMVLSSLLKPIKNRYDFILLDTGPTQGIFMWNALFASDLIIIPTQTSYTDVQEISGVLANINRVSQESTNKVNVIGILPTNYRQNLFLDNDILEKLKTTFDPIPILTPIPISTDVKEAYGAGKPIHKFNNKVPATTAYIDLGRSVVKKIRQLKGQVSDERS
jgi:chromosome partitioning protein